MEDVHLILVGLGAVVLLALLVNLFRAMTRFTLAICAVLACLALGAVALSFGKWSEIPTPGEVYLEGNAQPEQTASFDRLGPSAAATVRRFWAGVIVVGLVTIGGTVIGWHWWKERQKRQRLQDALQQAQIYALMSGERVVTELPRRLSQGGGNVIVVSGELQPPAQATLPDGSGWEVLQ